jgi:hypothetical protein
VKGTLLLLRQFLTPFSGWPWLSYFGVALIPLLLLIGMFNPRFAFGLAVWDYIILLAIPFTLAPKMLRTLICNRRLVLVPGLARRAVVVALLFTLLHAGFINAMAAFYRVPGPHLHNAVQMFVVSSFYMLVMQYAVTTAWAVVLVSLFPLVSIVTILFITLGRGQQWLGDDHLAWLMLATGLGWGLGWWRCGRDHRFRPEHPTMEQFNTNVHQHAPVVQWLMSGSSTVTAPDATLLIGYPANLATRLRVLVYMVFLGPVVGTLTLSLTDFGSRWSYHPGVVDIFLGASLFPATFAAFHSIEWVARLRLLWLRRRCQREELWQLLERQQAISLLLLLVVSLILLTVSLQFSGLRSGLLLHYPLLIASCNAFYGYYIVCARTSAWPRYLGFTLSIVGSVLVFAAVATALALDDVTALYVLEGVALIAAAALRRLGHQRMLSIDWLVVRPFQGPRHGGAAA